MQKNCKNCSITFEITQEDLEFYNKISPVFAWKKYEIPAPENCPECRQQRRWAFRNETKLYRRKCSFSNKEIISNIAPDVELNVYSQDIYLSDKWDALDYGQDFNFSRTFFEQFRELQKKVPVSALNNKLVENCDFVNDCVNCKNCYLTFSSVSSTDSLYNYILRDWDNCVDTAYCDKCFNSYDLLECGGNSHNLFFSFKSSKCLNSYFLFSCFKCEECIWCTNLVDKKYYIFNRSYSEKEYFIEKEKLFKKWFDYIKSEYEKLKKKSIKKYMIGYANEDVYWDNIFFSKNCIECYDSNHLQDCKYIYTAMEVVNSYDIYLFWKGLELSYNSISVWENSYKIFFSNSIINSSNIFYSKDLIWCKSCFWCIWLKNQQYCIFNQKYNKLDYEKLVSKIIEKMQEDWEWWEFFPEEISIFYNSNYEAPFPKVEKIIPANKLPENISDIPDDILNWAIECEVSKKPFKIIKQELDFYRKHNLPIPRKHPDIRHSERMKQRNPRKLFERECYKCWKNIKTTYSSDREEIVYCEDCYNKEIY